MKLRIAIIIGTTREGRFGDRPANWILEMAQAHGGADFEIIDLRDFPMPLFDEPTSPAWGSPKNEVALHWARRVGEFDGYIFITAEYNHGISAVLKNALDHVYAEFHRKPAAFVGYGGVGGARAIEQLRLICVELQMAPLRNAVHIGLTEFLGMLKQNKQFGDFPHLEQSAKQMLDELLWWCAALRYGRLGA